MTIKYFQKNEGKKIQFCPGLDAWIRFQISLDTSRKVKSFQLCNDTYASQKCCQDWVWLQNHNISRCRQHAMSDSTSCVCCPETCQFDFTSSLENVPVLNELWFTVLSILAFHWWLICRKVVPWRKNTASTVLISKTYFAKWSFFGSVLSLQKTAFASRTCHLAKNIPWKHRWEESYEKVRLWKTPHRPDSIY